MPPKGKQPHKNTQNRVRPTQRSLEAKQFSTVRLPRGSEVAVNRNSIHEQYESMENPNVGNIPSTSAGGFDPISNDGMFTVVANSRYWPPMPLEQLLEKAPPELLGKVRTDDDDKRIGTDSDDDDFDDDDNLNNNDDSDDEDDNAASASPSTANKNKKDIPSSATKAERIQQILNSDGAMDLYDRRDDEAKARKMLAKAQKKAGELSHPRGKAPVNSKKTFDDSDSD